MQNAMAQVQRPCGEGRVAKRKKAPSSAADSGRRLLEQVRACAYVYQWYFFKY